MILILNDIILKLIYLSMILYTNTKKNQIKQINHSFFDQKNQKYRQKYCIKKIDSKIPNNPVHIT